MLVPLSLVLRLCEELSLILLTSGYYPFVVSSIFTFFIHMQYGMTFGGILASQLLQFKFRDTPRSC